MNKYYLIVPGVLLSAFVVFERDFAQRRTEEEKVHAIAVAAAKEEAEKERLRREAVAADEARKRTEERERLERERAEKKRRDYEASMAKLAGETDEQVREADKLTEEAASLAAQVDALKTRRVSLDRETFELARKVELQRVDRRSTELELQRATTMVARRLAQIPAIIEPPVPAPAPAK
jgi:hypothetical protein